MRMRVRGRSASSTSRNGQLYSTTKSKHASSIVHCVWLKGLNKVLTECDSLRALYRQGMYECIN